MKKTVLEIGDVYAIPLSDGRMAYAQYLHNGELGAMIQIFDLVTAKETSLERLEIAGLLFPPVYAGIRSPLRSGHWRIIGRLPVKSFVHPKFRITFGTKPGIYHDWRIWDGEQYTFIGSLPEECRSLEFECLWGSELLEERIRTGHNPFDGVY